MADENATGAAQEAATTQTPAQEATNPAPQAGGSTAQEAGDFNDIEEAKKIRRENATLRKRLAEYDAAQKAAEEAKLGDLEKATKRAEAAEAQAKTAQERIIRAEVKAEATLLGINPALAARLVDVSAVEYDDALEPTNIAKLLQAAVKEYGIAPNATTQAPRPTVGAPMNAGRTANTPPLTWDAIGQMTAAEYAARQTEIQQWMLKNPPQRR